MKASLPSALTTAALVAILSGCAASSQAGPPATAREVAKASSQTAAIEGQPHTVGTREIAIAGTAVFPESITSDGAGNLYDGSIPGAIYRTLRGETTAQPWILPGPDNGIQSIFGVFADDSRGVLWACSNPNRSNPSAGSGLSELKAFDLITGKLRANYPLPAGKPVLCNDIAVSPDGTVWVSETIGGRIFVLRPGAKALQLWAETPDLVGVDGIAVGSDYAIYINNVRKGLFQRVEGTPDGQFDHLTTLTLSDTLNGPDGLRSIGNNRFLQAEGPGGRVALLTLRGNDVSLTPVATGLEGSVGVTLVGKTVYLVEGKLNYLLDPALKGKTPDGFSIKAFPLPAE